MSDYRTSGYSPQDDTFGVKNIAPVEYNSGNFISITTPEECAISEHPHLGYRSRGPIRDFRARWPRRWIDGGWIQPGMKQNAAILGAHYGAPNATLPDHVLGDIIGDAPSGLVRHILWGAHHAFQKAMPGNMDIDGSGYAGGETATAAEYFHRRCANSSLPINLKLCFPAWRRVQVRGIPKVGDNGMNPPPPSTGKSLVGSELS